MKSNTSPKTTLPRILAAVLCFAAASTLSGCKTTDAAGSAAYTVISDEDYTAAAPMTKAWDATLAGMTDMNLLPEAKSPGVTKSTVEAIGPEDRRVRITLKSDSAEVTSIYIRVGITGDKVFSRQLMEKIKSRL